MKRKPRVYITGDCHAEWRRFSTDFFPDQKDLTRDDFIIVCGDFGIWHDTESERWWLKWMEEKPFTILFVDGNHENFDRLMGGEFEEVDFHGGRAHKIRENVYHLMRGYVFTLCGKKFFAFGGAQSHDIRDGILDEADFENHDDFLKEVRKWDREDRRFRINHLSWWKEEMPSIEECLRGRNNLAENGNSVDYIITHCAPSELLPKISDEFEPDALTKYFDIIRGNTKHKTWYCGHYHQNRKFPDNFNILYREIERVV